jgi:hypothetical protein
LLHTCCIFAAYLLHIYCIFTAYFLHCSCIFDLAKCIFCIFYAYFCIFIQFYCLCPWPGFSSRAPGPPRSAWHAKLPMAAQVTPWHPSIPSDQTTPLAILARPCSQHLWKSPDSPLWTVNSGTLESLLCEHWTVERPCRLISLCIIQVVH